MLGEAGDFPLRMIGRRGLRDEPGDDERGKCDRNDSKQRFRFGHEPVQAFGSGEGVSDSLALPLVIRKPPGTEFLDAETKPPKSPPETTNSRRER
jgi:hypothetical protein